MKMEREHKKLRGRDQKEDLVFDTFTRCIQLWNNGHQASFSIECKDGEAMMKFSAFLGSQENRNFVPTSPVTTVPTSPRKSRSSPSKRRRNRERASAHQERKRLEFEAIHLRETNSKIEKDLPVSQLKSEGNVSIQVSDKETLKTVSVDISSHQYQDNQLCFIVNRSDNVDDDGNKEQKAADHHLGPTDGDKTMTDITEASKIEDIDLEVCGGFCSKWDDYKQGECPACDRRDAKELLCAKLKRMEFKRKKVK